MRQAGRIISRFFRLIEKEVRPGVATERLDQIAEDFIRSEGAIPAFKGYRGYPAALCTSINEQVVHGVPSRRVLKEGEIVGIDVGVKFSGFYADAARTYVVGVVSLEIWNLLETTKRALAEGIKKAVEGNHLGDISWAIQSTAEEKNFSVVREYVGHGIGRSLHEPPQVPNYGKPNRGPVLKEGMVFAIEPMLNMGLSDVEVLSDGWTVVAKDRKCSSHFEDTVFVGKEKPEIITE